MYIFLFYSLAIFPLQKIPICPRVGVSYEGFFLFTYLHATILRLHMFAPTPSVLLLYHIYNISKSWNNSSSVHFVLIDCSIAGNSILIEKEVTKVTTKNTLVEVRIFLGIWVSQTRTSFEAFLTLLNQNE